MIVGYIRMRRGWTIEDSVLFALIIATLVMDYAKVSYGERIPIIMTTIMYLKLRMINKGESNR